MTSSVIITNELINTVNFDMFKDFFINEDDNTINEFFLKIGYKYSISVSNVFVNNC